MAAISWMLGFARLSPTYRSVTRARKKPGRCRAFFVQGLRGDMGDVQGAGRPSMVRPESCVFVPTTQCAIGNLTGNDSDLLHFSPSFRYTMPNGLRPAGKGCEASYPFFLCMANQIYSVA